MLRARYGQPGAEDDPARYILSPDSCPLSLRHAIRRRTMPLFSCDQAQGCQLPSSREAKTCQPTCRVLRCGHRLWMVPTISKADVRCGLGGRRSAETTLGRSVHQRALKLRKIWPGHTAARCNTGRITAFLQMAGSQKIAFACL
jgi:hypothetical protein